MDLQVIDGDVVSVSDSSFDRSYNPSLVHQVVTAFLAGGRAGSKAQKNRAAVRGGGIKPWRQKGTGRARAGTIRSPIWRAGGVTFAAQPRDYTQKVNKKMYRAAMSSIFSELIRSERLAVVNELELPSHKTRDLAAKLTGLDLSDVLIVTDGQNDNLKLASRNLPHVDVFDVTAVNPVALLRNKKVLITRAALENIGAWLE